MQSAFRNMLLSELKTQNLDIFGQYSPKINHHVSEIVSVAHLEFC